MRLCLVYSTDLLELAQYSKYHIPHGTDNPPNLLKCSFCLMHKEEYCQGIKAPFLFIFSQHNAAYISN